MSSTTPLAGWTIPSLSEAANGPAAFSTLANAIEKQVTLVFATTAARDAAIPSPVAGMEVWTTTGPRLYRYDGTGWIIMYEPKQTWTVALSNFTITNSTGSWTQRCAGFCFFEAFVTVSACASGGVLTLPFATLGIPAGALNVCFEDTGVDLSVGVNSAVAAAGTTCALRIVKTDMTWAKYGDTTATTPHTWGAGDKVNVHGFFLMNTPYL